ncbi:MAG: ABC transporter permease [Oscillospiraceae bacterium]|nr:ABC transporter permease [Oscillospiraceae bacterium]
MTKPKLFADSYTMFKRCLTKALRSPEAIFMATLVPIVMMLLFGYVFGGIASVGNYSYINFIVPGIIIQCVTNASSATALGIHSDMTTGIIDRFRSMAISKTAVISGHVWVSVIRSMIITAITIGAAFAVGFRPSAGLTDWLMIAGILTLFIIAVTWIAVIFGLIAKDAESISGTMFLLVILTFLSSGFTPTDTLPTVLRVFAENQPMTPIINTLRGLMLGVPSGNALPLALAWSGGIIVVAYLIATGLYRRKMSR